MDLSTSGCDWNSVVEHAIENGTATLLFSQLASKGFHGMPPAVVDRLRKIYLSTLISNRRMMADAAHAVQLLENGGVKTVLIKGMAMLADVYEDAALRRTSDADILIHFEDLDRAKKILMSDGFACDPLADKSSFANELGFGRKNTVFVEVRWDMCHHDRFRFCNRFSMGGIFTGAAAADLNGAAVKIPSPEYQLLIAAFHQSFVHHFEKKMWLYDIVAIADRYGKDLSWERVVQLSETCGMRRALAYTFLRARREFNFSMKLPLEISRLRVRLLDACSRRRYGFLVELLLLDCLKDLLLYAAGVLWPSDGWLKHHYRTSSTRPWRFLHPFLVAAGAIKKILGIWS
ncbi:MAG: nucleotidyltransferase family protein [Pseudomonadota bacterium]